MHLIDEAAMIIHAVMAGMWIMILLNATESWERFFAATAIALSTVGIVINESIKRI